MDRLEERRLARAIVVAAALLFLALFAVQRPVFETPDEAKYIGLGLNLLAGRGLVTDLGGQFLNHPPVWPLALAVPQAWFGLAALDAGHVLDALSGTMVIVLAAALAWRVRPAAGAVTAVALLATSYLASLARTAGVDLPAAVWGLAYLLVAARAVERGSVRLGLLAGLCFSLGFLTKETILPFAPIPFLVAWLGPARGQAIARSGAAALLATTVLCAWWFALYGGLTGTVYRLGGPAWLLVPLGLADGLVIAVGLLSTRLSAPASIRQRLAAVSARSMTRLRVGVGWAAIVGWLLLQLAVYARAAKLGGLSILRGSQLMDDLQVYLPQLGIALGFALAGSLLAFGVIRRAQAGRELAAAAVAQLPLVLLVLGIGETPRHYIAGLALVVGLGSVGWVEAARIALGVGARGEAAEAGGFAADSARPRTRARVALGLAFALAVVIAIPQLAKVPAPALAAAAVVVLAGALAAAGRSRWPAGLQAMRPGTLRVAGVRLGVGALGLGLTFLVGAGIATATAYRASVGSPVGVAEARAVDQVGSWLRANLPDGATIMVGPGLAYDLALAVHDHQRVVRLQPTSASVERGAPFGLASGRQPIEDPVTLEAALRNVDFVSVYEADSLAARIRAVGPAAWVEAVYVPAAAPTDPVLAMFDAASGVARLGTWSFDYGDQRLLVVAYRIDPGTFEPRAEAVFASPDAIDVMARLLGSVRDGVAARRLVDAVTPIPPGPDADAAVAALRAVAGP